MNKVEYQPIGYIKSPIVSPKDAPIQPTGARDITGQIVIDQQYSAGLKDLDGFSHIIVLYHLHKHKPYKLVCKPFLDDVEHGVFAIRAPNRPNSIGFSVVRLTKVVDNVIYISGVDMIDGTPVLDIKPYVPKFDAHPDAKIGWLEKNAERSEHYKSDDRFIAD